MRTHVCYYKINRTYVFKCKEVAELGDRSAMETGLCMDIPIQVMALTDRDGRITPYWIRLESQTIRSILTGSTILSAEGKRTMSGSGKSSLSAISRLTT